MTVHRLFWIPKWYISVSRRIQRASVVCRMPPPTMHLSVSPLEKIDAQIQLTSVGFVPATDPRSIGLGGNHWPLSDPRQEKKNPAQWRGLTVSSY
jgi:hypothetical protein